MNEKFEFPSRGFWIVADKVGEADYFLELLKQSKSEYKEFGYILSAYVSAGRSITFSLQSVMSHYPGFSEWYKKHQEQIKKNDLAKYYVNLRNHLQKVGSTPIYHSGSMHHGSLEFNQCFIPINDLANSPEGEVATLSEEYLKTILQVIKACYRDYKAYVDPRELFTTQGLSELGWSIEDLEESLGFPRGWTDISSDDPNIDKERLKVLSRYGGDEEMEKYFEKYEI